MRSVSERTLAQAQKRQDRFNAHLTKLLLAAGAVPTDGSCGLWNYIYPLTIATSAGEFMLSPDSTAAMGHANATLFGYFPNSTRAHNAGFTCNPHTGKMNVHGDRIKSLGAAHAAAELVANEMFRRLRLNQRSER